MKKVLFIACLLITSLVIAQPGGKMRERIKSQKIAFITEKLNFTSEEAQKFWPIYNTFESTTEQIKSQELRTIKQKMRLNPDMSSSEANALLDDFMDAESRMFNAKVKLVNDLKDVLPPNKIIRLKTVEDEFNRKLLERLRDFREKRRNRD